MLLGWLKTHKKRYFSLLVVVSFSTLATQDSEQMPDMALLEYLAELVEVDGELIGPLDMEEDVQDATETQATDNDEIDNGQPPSTSSTSSNSNRQSQRPIKGAQQ